VFSWMFARNFHLPLRRSRFKLGNLQNIHRAHVGVLVFPSELTMLFTLVIMAAAVFVRKKSDPLHASNSPF